jgi:hypothetical protein
MARSMALAALFAAQQLGEPRITPAFLMGSAHRTTEAVAASAASFTLRIICRR